MTYKQLNIKNVGKYLLVATLLFFVSGNLTAQDYRTAVGVRGGYPSGLNVKHFIKKDVALEGIISGYARGFEFTGLYEIHKQAFDTPYLNWYYGPGFHIGSFGDRNVPFYYRNRYENGSGLALGLDAVLGLEYTLDEIPFVLGVDIKPAIDFLPGAYFYVNAGLSVRFYF